MPNNDFAMTPEQIVTLAKSYGEHRSLKLSSLGVYTVNDGKFLVRLENGGDATTRMLHKALTWFDENWPQDLEWPYGVERPSKRAA